MSKRKLCIVTGSRAEWGLFYPLATEIKRNADDFTLQIIATGSHVSGDFGLTYREIEKDGFRIDRSVKIPLASDSEEAIVNSVSFGMKGIAAALKTLRPDLVFLLGDRFETFSAATASFFLKMPIGHIQGGELTEGSLDEGLRHAITKMAHLHFASTDIYKKRVTQMGEDPKSVFTVGALGLDNIRNTRFLERKLLEEEINFRLGKKNIMVTFCPCTSQTREVTVMQFRNLLKAVDELKDTKIIFTKPNPDMYSKNISELIDKYVSRNKKKAVSFASMGRELYLSALGLMDAVAGNSSSGIIETPSFGIPTVNIGNRQKGRLKPVSVIDADGDLDSINKALRKAFCESFKKKSRNVKNPYGDGHAARRIIQIVKKMDFFRIRKRFFDLNFNFCGRKLSKAQI